MKPYICFITFFIITISGCNDDTIEQFAIPSKNVIKITPMQNGSLSIQPSQDIPTDDNLSWHLPDTWSHQKSTGIRIANFDINVNDKIASCALFKLSGDAGGEIQNINRWRTQVALPSINTIEHTELLNKIKKHKTAFGTITTVTVINEQSPETAIIGAILPTNTFVIFAKITTTKANILAVQDDFITFVQSIKYTTDQSE